MGRIKRGTTASGQRIIEICNWSRHQKIQHPNLKGSLPEIVEIQALPVPHEPLMRDSGGAHEPLTHHTNDQRPVPTTSTNDLPLLLLPVVPDGTPAGNKAKAAKRAKGAGAQFPHYPMDLCLEMHAMWVSQFGGVDVGRFRGEFGPLFTVPEADRPPEAPTNRELRDAMKAYADLAPMGDGARFASVRRAAAVLALIAKARREHAHDPERRLDAVMQIIHGRRAGAAA